MCRARGTQDAGVRLQVEIKLDGMGYIAIHNRAGEAVATLRILLFGVVGREETHMVSFPDDDDRNLRHRRP